MSVTVRLADDQRVRVTEETVEAKPPDGIDFTADGFVTMDAGLLGEFEGQSFVPVRVGVAVEGAGPVEIDLTDAATLRLQNVDVGVETPDLSDGTRGVDSVHSAASDRLDSDGDVIGSNDEEGGNGDSKDSDASRSEDESESTGAPGALSFTVAGAINGVPPKTVDQLADASCSLQSITFGVEDAVKSDGGEDEVLVEFTLVGYGIVVYRNGTIEVGTGDRSTDIGLL